MVGFDPHTFETLTDADEAMARAERMLTTPIGTREKSRGAGSEVPDILDKQATPKNRMILINRIFRAFRNPNNQVSDIKATKVHATIVGDGYEVFVDMDYKGEKLKVSL